MNVPVASVEEILPAARLLSRATGVTPADFERAKALFLEGVQNAGVAAQVFITPSYSEPVRALKGWLVTVSA